MTSEPEPKADRFFLWSMFVLPAVAGTLSWMVRDRVDYAAEIAFIAWGCAVLSALTLIFDHYRKPPGDR
jgi:hypothetical protein